MIVAQANANSSTFSGSALSLPFRLLAAPGYALSYFAEAPDPGQGSSHPGPVLVMPPAKKPKRPHLWLQRLWLVVFVLFCLEVGIILTVLPWTRLWTDNSRCFPILRFASS